MKSFIRSVGFAIASVTYSLYSIRKSNKTRVDYWGCDPFNLLFQMSQTVFIFGYICSNTCFEHEVIGIKVCEPSFIWFQLMFSLQDRVLNLIILTLGDHIRIRGNLIFCGLHKIGVAIALWYLWADRFEQIFTMYLLSQFGLFWHLKTAKEVMILVHQGKLGQPYKVEEEE